MNSANGRPLVDELPRGFAVEHALEAFADVPGLAVLESALRRADVGRYSFLTADPCRLFQCAEVDFGSDPFAAIRAAMAPLRKPRVSGLPPFQGGALGVLGYELGGCWERIPRAAHDEFSLPAMAVGLYDWTLAWDHRTQRAWVIVQDLPVDGSAGRRVSAGERLEWIRRRLAGEPSAPLLGVSRAAPSSPLPIEWLAPQWPAPGLPGLTSDFSRNGYLQAVEQVIEKIRAGDIFQANLSQRLLAPLPHSLDAVNLYRRLRLCNPAPFAGLFTCDDWAIVSASPERFLRLVDGAVETRPIKGTRQRRVGPEADLFTREELRDSEKDRAENVMIVDLLRNDLSRVCRPGTIRVPRLCTVETYETVQHLVSVVTGELAGECDAWDLIRVAFPGGSISGAPKVCAMEIIAELEPTVRGPYCGSLVYVGFDGTMDSSLLIRTFTVRHGWIQCPVGGGIVAQSDPLQEYAETLHKAEGMLRALRSLSESSIPNLTAPRP